MSDATEGDAVTGDAPRPVPVSPLPDLRRKLLLHTLVHDGAMPPEMEVEAFTELAERSPRLTAWWSKATSTAFPTTRTDWFELLGRGEIDPALFIDGRIRPREVLAYMRGKLAARQGESEIDARASMASLRAEPEVVATAIAPERVGDLIEKHVERNRWAFDYCCGHFRAGDAKAKRYKRDLFTQDAVAKAIGCPASRLKRHPKMREITEAIEGVPLGSIRGHR